MRRSARDFHGDGLACDQLHIVGHRVQVHTHGHALREAHPVEGRVHGGQQIGAGGAVAVCNAGDDAFHRAGQRFADTHRRDLDVIAHVNACELGLFKIAFDVERLGIHQRHGRTPSSRVAAFAQVEVGDEGIAWRDHFGALQIEARGVERDLRLGERGLCLLDLGAGLFAHFLRDQVVEAHVAGIFALGLCERDFL